MGGVFLSAGAGTGTGSTGGNINLQPGTGVATNGQINFKDSSGTTQMEISSSGTHFSSGLSIGAQSSLTVSSSSPVSSGSAGGTLMSRLVKGSVTIDCSASSNNVFPGSEAEFDVSVSSVTAGDLVLMWPADDTVASASSILWNSWTTSTGITLRISNQHAATAFTNSGTW